MCFLQNIITPFIFSGNGDAENVNESDNESFCFGILGCIKTPNTFFDPIFRPVNLPPWKREEIDTRFYLYTRDNQEGKIITNKLIHEFLTSTFKSSRPTKLVIHGYMDNSKVTWMMVSHYKKSISILHQNHSHTM